MSNFFCEPKTPISSSNRKSVSLHEWWLIEVEKGSRLGIGGLANREALESRGIRLLGSASVGKRCNLNTLEAEIQVFHSAAIAKRLDNNTIEATDGVTITISGCINRSRTLSYGFLPEVCDRFLSGFPCNWEEYAAKYSHGKSADTAERSFPMSFDDHPVYRVRDILMSTTGESESCAFTSIIFEDILKQCSFESRNQVASSVDSGDKGSRNSMKIELDHEQDGVSSLNPTEKIIEDVHKIYSVETENNGNQGKDGYISDATNEITEKIEAKTCIQIQADSNLLSGSCSKVTDPKPSTQSRHAEEGNTTTATTNKRIASRAQQRYPLRSKRVKND